LRTSGARQFCVQLSRACFDARVDALTGIFVDVGNRRDRSTVSTGVCIDDESALQARDVKQRLAVRMLWKR
jgi:hypothetical protein